MIDSQTKENEETFWRNKKYRKLTHGHYNPNSDFRHHNLDNEISK